MSAPSGQNPLPAAICAVVEDIDHLRSRGLGRDSDLFALLAAITPSQCWMLFAPANSCDVRLKLLARPTELTLTDLQLGGADAAFHWFTAWAGELVAAQSGARMLVVKVDDGQLWFLRVPLAIFSRHGRRHFSKYESVSWIVTERTFSESLSNREALAQLLRTVPDLLDGTVIVINTYRHHQTGTDAGLIGDGLRVIEGILSQLQDIQFADRPRSLRWVKNPGSEELKRILLSPETRVILAAFEAGAGRWQLGEAPAASEKAPRSFFDLGQFGDRLHHIQLMRVFHCYSIFDPYKAAVVGGAPADDHTVVRQLLQSGVQVVEGAIAEQSYLEFLASVIEFLFKGSLRFLFDSLIAQKICDRRELFPVLNRILSTQGYQELS